ncbi:MAG: transporter [Desulfobaccales bacterium]
MNNSAARKTLWLVLAMVLGFHWTLAWSPASAQGPAAPLMENPKGSPEEKKEEAAEEKKEEGGEEKKEEAPTTCGPLITDTCIPIDEHHASLQVLGGLSFYQGNFSPNWRYVSAHGDFYTFNMPVKFTYGPAKNLETYIIAPFIVDWANHLDRSAAGPNGERSASYAGIGDITAVAKYLVLPEEDTRPAVSLVGGAGFPSGHASNLNSHFLNQDAVGTGSFNFISGVNLYKWLKPLLLYSNIWLNSPANLFTSNNDAVRSREYVTFNLAAEYPLSKSWVLLAEMYSTWTWTNISTPQGFQSPSTLLGVLPGVEYLINEKWAVSAGSSFDLLGKAGSRKYTPICSLYYNF